MNDSGEHDDSQGHGAQPQPNGMEGGQSWTAGQQPSQEAGQAGPSAHGGHAVQGGYDTAPGGRGVPAGQGQQVPSGAGWWSAPAGGMGTQPMGGVPPIGQQPPGVPPGGGPTTQLPEQQRQRGRRKLYTGIGVTALVAAIIGGGIGVGGGYLIAGGDDASAPTITAQAPNVSSASLKPGSAAYAAKAAGKSTVDIKVAGQRKADEGTGIVLSQDGYVLTNNHVVTAASGGGKIQVTLPNGDKKSATIKGTAPSYDLAVIKVDDASGLTPAEFGRSKDVKVGEPVAAIGSPFGYSNTVTSGIVSALSRTITSQVNGQAVVYTGLQTDASINPGNSGGPLVNMSGQVIGVNSTISTGNSASEGQAGSIGIGFSIPADTARRVANDLMHHGYTKKPVLGVQGHLSKSQQGSAGNGASIAGVQDGSGADKAGLQKGDTVTKINGKPVDGYADLMARVLEFEPGQQITVQVKTQDGQTKKLHVTLGGTKDESQTTVPDTGGNPFGGFGGRGGH